MNNAKLRLADFRISYAAYLRLGLGLAAAGLSTQSALADTTWTGATNQDWNTATNWSNGLPLDAANNGSAIINTSTGNFPVISSGTSVTDWDVLIGSGAGGTGRLDHTSGTITTGNGNWMFVGVNGGTGTYNISGDANLNAGALNISAWGGGGGSGVVNVNTSGTINLTAGNPRSSGFGDASLLVGENAGNGTLNLQAGTMNAAFGATFGQGNSTGKLNMTGGTLNVTGEFQMGRNSTGTATQSAGTVNVTSYFVLAREQGSVSTYDLSGGTLNTGTVSGFTSIGSSRGTTGTLSVSGTGIFNSNAGMILGEGWQQTGAATGILNLSGGGQVNVGANGIEMARDAVAVGTVNLDGGTLVTTKVFKGAGTANFNFNGGTLKAPTGATNFMTGLTSANVLAGGAIIDSNSYAITIEQPLLAGAGNGGLTKTGTGTLTLSGASTYTGNTQVNAGTLAINGSITSNVVVGATGTLGGTGVITGSASLNTGGSLQVDTNGFVPLQANSFTFSGTNPVVFTGSPLSQGATYDVVTVPSGGTITGVANLVATARGTFGTATDKVTFTAGGVGTRTWNTTNGNWEINGAANWLGGDLKFLNGDTVVFNERPAASTVTLVGSLLPEAITVNNTTNPYTFSGSGSIAGAASLTKSGSGALTLATSNSHSGYTTLEAGTLNLANPAALGTSLFVVSGGTLDNTSGSALTLVNNVQQAWNGDFTFTGTHSLDMGSGLVMVGGDGIDRTITVNANTLVVGEINATSNGLIKQGAGTLEVTSVGVGNNASVVSGGSLNVAAGTLQINRTGSNGDGSGDFTVAGLTGSGTITNGAAVERWFFSNPFDGTFNFTGTLANGTGGTLGFYKNGAGTQILSGANSYTARTSVDGGGELRITGANSGTGTYTEVINGKLTLANNQSLGTNALIRFFGVDLSTLDLAMDTAGTPYAITKGTGTSIAIVSNRATPGAGINHTLTTETLANGLGGGTINFTSGTNVTSGTGRVTFTQFGLGAGSVQATTLNPTTANVTLGNVSKQNNDVSQTLDLGGTSSDNLVTGVISNGTPLTGANNISVLKTGTSTWTLSGANTYTGTTTVNEGTLTITQATLSDAAAVNVLSAGVLNLTHASTDTVGSFLIDGVAQASGTWGSLTSSATNKTARITGTGILLVNAGGGGFSNWSTANAGGQTADQDFDGDGVMNGVEFFFGATGSTFTANPGLVSGTITWPKSATYTGTYKVWTSGNLSTWTDVTANAIDNGTSVTYTPATGQGKIFVRLEVTPN